MEIDKDKLICDCFHKIASELYWAQPLVTKIEHAAPNLERALDQLILDRKWYQKEYLKMKESIKKVLNK